MTKLLSLERLPRREELTAILRSSLDDQVSLFHEGLYPVFLAIIQEELTHRQREILLHYFLEEKTMAQIAGELQIHKSTVCRTIHAALDKIKYHLQYYLLIQRDN